MRLSVVIFILLLTLLLFFHEPLFLGKVFYQKDILPFFYPMAHLTMEAIKAGYVPLWNPYVLCGVPHLATLEPAVFHPLNLILYLVPFPYAYTLLTVLTYFLSSVFMYLLAKTWGLSSEASLLSAVTFTYGGFTLSSVSYLNILFPLSWVPLILYLFEKSLTQKGILYPLASGMVLSFQLLGGDFVPTMLTCVMITGYACLSLKERGREVILKLTLLFSYALAFSMVQLLPTLELSHYALRSQGADYAYLTRFSFHPLRILEFFIPNLLGTLSPTEYFWGKSFFQDGTVLFPSVYMGALALPLMLLGVSFRRNKTTLFLSISFILSLILALGQYTPFYYFLYKTIPLFRMIPNPDKYILWNIFAGAALVGFGSDEILKRYQVGKHLAKVRIIFLCLLLLLTLDLYRINSQAISLVDKALYLDKPALITLLEQQESSVPRDLNKFFRIYRPSPLIDTFGIAPYQHAYQRRDTLESNVGMLYHISDVEGFVPAELAHYDTLLKALELVSLPRQISFLEMLNVQYLLAFKPLESEKLEPVFVSGESGFWVYRLKDTAQRVAWVTPVAYLERKVDLLNQLLEEHFDPQHHVVLMGKEQRMGETEKRRNKETEKEQVFIKEYFLTRVTLQTQHPSGGVLLLRDTYYPGWKAFVDKTETEILRANYVQRAVYVPKGEHLVEFRYEPFSYKLGLFLTLSALLIFLVQMGVNQGSNTKKNKVRDKKNFI